MTKQDYGYDGLYQLTSAVGNTEQRYDGKSDPYISTYEQYYMFDDIGLGRMETKTSSSTRTTVWPIGDELNYNLDYEYAEGFVYRASRIGDRFYQYDANGNLILEQGGEIVEDQPPTGYTVEELENDTYSVDYAWGVPAAPEEDGPSQHMYKRTYTWNERNLMTSSSDQNYFVQYHYGHDGERTGKFHSRGNGAETLYFNKMWSWKYSGSTLDSYGQNSKHVYLGDTRIVTKISKGDGSFTSEEVVKQYYYHSDHLGSAQLITNYEGAEYERLEYTPYGEVWVEKASDDSNIDIPFRFTGKERDEETGLYYYGARYQDPKTSRWLSTDPALGEYMAGSSIGQGGIYNSINMHLYHYSFNNPIKYTDPTGRSGEAEGEETWSISDQLSYLQQYVSDANNMSPQDKANAAGSLRDEMRNSGRYDIDGLMTGEDGNEQFMNETLRDFLNTSDTGLPYTMGDMTAADGWSQKPGAGSQEHQTTRQPGMPANRKFTNTDGREAVFTTNDGDNWTLSNDVRDKGTYNYAKNTNNPFSGSQHGKWDMNPYFRQFGITPSYGPVTGYGTPGVYNQNGRTNGTGHY